MVLVVVFLNVLLLEFVVCTEWSYKGDVGAPSTWYQDYPACGKTHQSPIDIVTDNVSVDDRVRPLKFHDYDKNLTGGTIINNGHTVLLQFPIDKTFTVSGGGFEPNTYRALQLHFHWAALGSTEGSEHTINGKRFPVEMHIVHIKKPYNAIDEVKGMSDGLAVLGVMFDIGPEENTHLQKLLDSLDDVKYAGSTATLSDGPVLQELLPPMTTFYRYFGSLTTPPCYEAVIWTVFAESALISQPQLAALQSLQSVEYGINLSDSSISEKDNTSRPIATQEGSLGDNFRPIQPVNERVVIFSGTYDSKANEPPIIIIVLSLLCGIFAFLVMVLLVKRCCCDKKAKDTSSSYKAGRPEDPSLL